MYSQKHMSEITRSSGSSFFKALMAAGTGPSGSRLPLPQLSLDSGMPKRTTAGTPSSAAAAASSTTVSGDHWNWPGIETMGFLTPRPGADEERIDQLGGLQVGLPDQGPHAGGEAQAAQADRTRRDDSCSAFVADLVLAHGLSLLRVLSRCAVSIIPLEAVHQIRERVISGQHVHLQAPPLGRG